jgi:4-amino-4-deoxy-L-arabinose transferase-like glycosyltransferase
MACNRTYLANLLHLRSVGQLLLFSLLCAWMLWLCQTRLVAMDEGFYLFAARLVAYGQVPYLDFFYPQTPLFPYLYAAWIAIFGASWEALRIPSALASTLLAIAIFGKVKEVSSPRAGLLAAVLFSLSISTIGWYSICKSYVLPALLLFWAYTRVAHVEASAREYLIAGILVGLAANMRLYMLTTLAPFALWALLCESSWREVVRRQAALVVGFALCMLPHLYWLMVDAQAWWFNMLGYHLIRSDASGLQMQQKLTLLKTLFSFNTRSNPDGVQFLLLTVLSLPALLPLFSHFRRLRFRRVTHEPSEATASPSPYTLSAMVALTLGCTNLMPNPSYAQYFCVLTPFLVLCAAGSLAQLWQYRAWGKLLVLLCVLGYSLQALKRGQDYLFSGRRVAGLETFRREPPFYPKTIDQIASRISAHAPGDELVLSQWPGFLVGTLARAYPGTENQFWIMVAGKMRARDRTRYRLFSMDQVVAALANPELKLVVIRSIKQTRYFPHARLESAGFMLAEELHGVRLYTRRKPS